MADETEALFSSKPIRFNWNGTDYIVEFNLETAKTAESVYGISYVDVARGDFKFTMLPDLFYCGMLMHHPNIKRTTTDTMLSQMKDKVELSKVLLGMFVMTVTSMLEDGSDDSGNAISWTR